MHHLPQFFSPRKRTKRMDPRKIGGKPKLGRVNAAKNIEYDAASSSSSQEDSTRSLYTRSMESPDPSSFRVEGIDDEFYRLCWSLGLSGPEDFAIPTAAWEARKALSSSDLLPRSRLHPMDSPKSEEGKEKEDKEDKDMEEELCRRVKDSVRITLEQETPKTELRELNERRMATATGCSSRSGINGARPPLLKPPPAMRLPVYNDCSTWDILKSFAPLVDGEDEKQDEVRERSEPLLEREAEGNLVRHGESIMESNWGSFTSNDDDSSSSTTEPANISPNLRCKPIITSWVTGKLLGRGSFGAVFEAISEDGTFFALKEVSLLDEDSQGRQSIYQLQQEIALLSEFQHENIVQYYGTHTDESKLYIFLELVSQGSLMSLYQRIHLLDSHVSNYTRQILFGLKYLHERNVVHRDIKCANILVDVNGSVKLADFGLAKATKLNDVKSCKGTAFWMAPEVVNGKGQGYGLPADIWSLGCTVLEMLTRKLPYSELESHMQALFKIGKGVAPSVPESLSKDGQDFILQCLQVNPRDRPAAADLLNHPFVRRPVSSLSGSASPYNRPGRRN